MRRFTISAALLLVLAACGSDDPTGPSTSLRAPGASTSELVRDTLPPPPLPAASDTTTATSSATSSGGILIGGAG
jgi:hypothetical protein